VAPYKQKVAERLIDAPVCPQPFTNVQHNIAPPLVAAFATPTRNRVFNIVRDVRTCA